MAGGTVTYHARMKAKEIPKRLNKPWFWRKILGVDRPPVVLLRSIATRELFTPRLHVSTIVDHCHKIFTTRWDIAAEKAAHRLFAYDSMWLAMNRLTSLDYQRYLKNEDNVEGIMQDTRVQITKLRQHLYGIPAYVASLLSWNLKDEDGKFLLSKRQDLYYYLIPYALRGLKEITEKTKLDKPELFYSRSYRSKSTHDDAVSVQFELLQKLQKTTDFQIILCGYYQISPFGTDGMILNKLSKYGELLRLEDEYLIQNKKVLEEMPPEQLVQLCNRRGLYLPVTRKQLLRNMNWWLNQSKREELGNVDLMIYNLIKQSHLTRVYSHVIGMWEHKVIGKHIRRERLINREKCMTEPPVHESEDDHHHSHSHA